MEPCPTCQKMHERDGVPTCLGHRTDGEPCGNYPIRGGTVCYKRHGGKAPQVWAAAQNRLQRAAAERVVATYGLSVAIDPFDAIMEELSRTYGHVKWLGEVIAEMEPVDLVWGDVTEEEGSGTGQREGDTHKTRAAAGINHWLVLYQSERKHLVEVSKAAIGVGIAEREIRLLERQGQMMADFVRGFIDDPGLGFDIATRQRMREVASQHLRMLTVAA